MINILINTVSFMLGLFMPFKQQSSDINISYDSSLMFEDEELSHLNHLNHTSILDKQDKFATYHQEFEEDEQLEEILSGLRGVGYAV